MGDGDGNGDGMQGMGEMQGARMRCKGWRWDAGIGRDARGWGWDARGWG